MSEMTEAGPGDGLALTPEARAIDEPKGSPVTLTDGREWLLHPAAPLARGGVWDRLYDSNVLKGKYQTADVLTAAYRLLRANYALSPEEAFDLFLGVDVADLVPPVEAALFGPRKRHGKNSDWVLTMLISNGIKPEDVPPERLLDVMENLVASGLAKPEAEWISSQRAMASRKRLFKAVVG